ncbi:MAG TPA: putative selenate reductase subunit YgfK [Firmicutes bacterium]|jgi:putative selenate reductase|nr:putative selenate reductase subunit YgfK [Bacillota bacterium]
MSDRMSPIPFDKLMAWILSEYSRSKSIFGVTQNKFFQKSKPNGLPLFETSLENPLGPAAGPHTQLAQNIIAAYLAGGRFFELKTVQILDGEDLPVAKPCILASDEGYNVEWSTELTVPDAMGEYIKAWFALHILAKELGLGSTEGFIFNMSVGYDLAGIGSPKIDAFINGLKDASGTVIWHECREYLLQHSDLFQHFAQEDVDRISPKICNSITLSTLHGCPPEEIERIAKYLLVEKGLHTYVKCNPTLLGYQFVRDTMDQMGYDYLDFDDHHFQNDLQFRDAIPMLKRLRILAKECHLTFGVKLSNTFPVKISRHELPGEEMYMSGRALYPLTINLAYQLAKEFNGNLKISYSGGADFYNVEDIYRTGIWPITFATTLLKPGGYLRIRQLTEVLDRIPSNLHEEKIDIELLQKLSEKAVAAAHYRKVNEGNDGQVATRKLHRRLPLTDCYIAPCKEGCPIGQDIPEYIRLVGEGQYQEALKLIVEKNPLPFITGTLCNHRCMTKCTRLDYEQAVDIRATKLVAAQKGFEEYIQKIKKPEINSAMKVAIIGAGPAGLSAAYFLGRQGVAVTVFDRKDKIGGIIEHIAPDFRITKEGIQHDLDLIRKMGGQFRLGVPGEFSVEALKKEGFKYIFIAIGAWKPGLLKLDSSDQEVINVLQFLEDYNKAPGSLRLGKAVAVIGAGNSAMDAARAAIRVPGVERVYLIYRRTRKYMSADAEEFNLALGDGVEFKELLSPLSYQKGILKCRKMILGAPDLSGRRSPQALSGEFENIPVDTLIAAVGEQVETDLLIRNHLVLDDKDHLKVNPETGETSVLNVFAGGDGLRGPATIAEAIADGTKFAKVVLQREKQQDLLLGKTTASNREQQFSEIWDKKGVLQQSCKIGTEHERCMECNVLCNLCVEVCPNRANVAIRVTGSNLKCYQQIIHIDGMCNECGNCAVFCPYEGAPYQDKLTLYQNEADFEMGKNAGFVLVDRKTNHFKVRIGDEISDLRYDKLDQFAGNVSPELASIIWTIYKDHDYLIK